MVVKKRQSINEAESLKVGDVVSVVGQRKPSVVLGVYPDAHAVKVTTVGNVDVDDVKKLSKSEVLSSIKRNLLLDLDVALLIQQGVISANQLDKDIDKDLLKRASKLMGEYNIPRLKESRIGRSKKALKEAINPEYDDGGYASFGIDISYEILDKNTQETIEQGEFYSSNEYILARTESELDIEYKMELRKAIGNNATYQNVLLSYQRPDRMSSYFLVEVDPEDYDLYFAEVEDNQEVSLTIRLTAFSHDEGMQIVGEDVTMDEIFMESQGKTNMQSKKALKEGGGAGYELIFPDYIAPDLEYDNFNDVPDFIEIPVEDMENVEGYDWSTGEISGVCGQLIVDKKLIMKNLLSDMNKDEIKNAEQLYLTDFEIESVVYSSGWVHSALKPYIEVDVLVRFSLYIGEGSSDKHYPYVSAIFMPSQLLCDTVEYENQYENDDDYYSDDDYYEESQGGKMKSKRALKESLITNGRKPISNLSINLFKEAQKKSRRKPIVEASTSYIQGALRAKEMDAQAVADLLSDFNADFEAVEEFAEDMGFEAKDVNTFLSAMFEMVIEKACQEVGCDYDDIADKITYYTNYLDSGMYVVNGDTIDDYDELVQAIKDVKSGKTNESKKSRRKPIVEAGGDEIWNRVERAKEYLGGGDYLLDDFVKAMSNDAVEDILDYIERTNDIGYNEEQMESLVTERMKKVIKESKQPRHKSTMKESKKSRRKPIVEAGGDEIWNRVERAKEYLGGGDYLLDDFVKAMSNDAVEDILDYIERTNDIGYNEEQMESLVTERMKKVIKESKQPRHKSTMKESKKSRRKPIVEAGGDAIWNRVERAKEYLGGGDYLLDDFVKAMSNDAVEDILDYIERVNDIGYDDEQMESLVTERMKKVIKESKQVSNKRALNESVAEQYRQPNGEALFYAELKYDFNNGEDAGVLEEVNFKAATQKELNRQLYNIAVGNVPEYFTNYFEAGEALFYYGNEDFYTEDIQELHSLGFKNAEEGDNVRIYGELYVVDAETDETISISDGVGLNDDVFVESKQSRRKPSIRESKSVRSCSNRRALKESLCMPISGMEYMVYKKGVLGEGSGKVVVIGIATVNGENVTINGTKYNKSQYDFVGTKGY